MASLTALVPQSIDSSGRSHGQWSSLAVRVNATLRLPLAVVRRGGPGAGLRACATPSLSKFTCDLEVHNLPVDARSLLQVLASLPQRLHALPTEVRIDLSECMPCSAYEYRPTHASIHRHPAALSHSGMYYCTGFSQASKLRELEREPWPIHVTRELWRRRRLPPCVRVRDEGWQVVHAGAALHDHASRRRADPDAGSEWVGVVELEGLASGTERVHRRPTTANNSTPGYV